MSILVRGHFCLVARLLSGKKGEQKYNEERMTLKHEGKFLDHTLKNGKFRGLRLTNPYKRVSEIIYYILETPPLI